MDLNIITIICKICVYVILVTIFSWFQNHSDSFVLEARKENGEKKFKMENQRHSNAFDSR